MTNLSIEFHKNTKWRFFYSKAIRMLASAALISSFFHQGISHAFDDVAIRKNTSRGAISSIRSQSNGITLTFKNGEKQEFRNVNNPKNGSPVTYIYQGEDKKLNAYVVDVWRVGKQVVLLSKSTGAFVEVGVHRSISPNKDFIFSSDCWETGCYYQLNTWPGGKRLIFSQRIGAKNDFSMNVPIDPLTVRWTSSHRIDFEITCTDQISSERVHAVLLSKYAKWQLAPENPCEKGDL